MTINKIAPAKLVSIMFKGQNKKTLNSIFQLLFNSELAQISGRLDVVNLDESLKKQYYSEYTEGMSLKEFIIKKWGEDFYLNVRKL